MTIEFELIGEGLSSLTLLWNISDLNNDDESISNRNAHLKERYCIRNKIKSLSELDKCISANFHCNLLKNLNGNIY